MSIKGEQRILDTRQWLAKQEKMIPKTKDEKFRRILYVTMMDSFAQNFSNYSKNSNQKQFAEFVCKYGLNRWQFLNEICPVTLFNYYADKYPISINLFQSRVYTAENIEVKNEAKRLEDVLLAYGETPDKLKKHTYANLVYAMRNKLVHELNLPGAPFDIRDDKENPIPNILQEVRVKSFEEKAMKDAITTWHLHIPELFLGCLLHETATNYIDECSQNCIEPFVNNDYNRMFFKAWYD